MEGLTGNYTLTYSESSKGFPSFYSYYPDYMIGMNRYLYSFKGGNLWRHNTNDERNTFYEQTAVSSTMTSVFNDTPLQNKIFKTLNLESDDAWKATLTSDIQTTGFIEASYFEKKEGDWFAFVRNSGASPANVGEYALRSLNGIGSSSSTDVAVPAAVEISFALTTNIGSIVSIGDNLYYIASPVAPNATPVFCGKIIDIEVDLPEGINKIIVDTSVAGGSLPPGATDYFLYIKNQVAESHGILGHYCEFTLELPNTVTTKSELFAVESEVMKSFP
tara:strand:+ start:881 stop:1708 length:828 start_codon:yes stop_codon:yes gene_type:complete